MISPLIWVERKTFCHLIEKRRKFIISAVYLSSLTRRDLFPINFPVLNRHHRNEWESRRWLSFTHHNSERKVLNEAPSRQVVISVHWIYYLFILSADEKFLVCNIVQFLIQVTDALVNCKLIYLRANWE